MGFSKIWVHGEATEVGVATITLELLAKARELADVVEVIMAAKNKPVDELDLAGLGIDPTTVGWSGARQEIIDVADAAARESGEVVVDEGDAHERILAFMDELKVL